MCARHIQCIYFDKRNFVSLKRQNSTIIVIICIEKSLVSFKAAFATAPECSIDNESITSPKTQTISGSCKVKVNIIKKSLYYLLFLVHSYFGLIQINKYHTKIMSCNILFYEVGLINSLGCLNKSLSRKVNKIGSFSSTLT